MSGMGSTGFGSLVTPQSGLGMGMRMRSMMGLPRIGLPKPKLGGLGMMRMAEGGMVSHPGMGYLTARDTMRSMPQMAMPDWMLARMADGGSPSAIEQLRRRHGHGDYIGTGIDREMIRPEMLGDRQGIYGGAEDYQGISRYPRGERALDDLLSRMGNSGLQSKMGGEESTSGIHDMAAAFLDPTQLPLFFGGSMAKLAPRILRQMPKRIPTPFKAAEFGAWGASDPNVRDALPSDDEDVSRRWGFYDRQRYPERTLDSVYGAR